MKKMKEFIIKKKKKIVKAKEDKLPLSCINMEKSRILWDRLSKKQLRKTLKIKKQELET